MSKSHHTPGPWKALEGKNGWQIHTDNKPSKGSPNANHWIANIKCGSCPAHEEGNARLVASAPELFNVLAQCEDYFDNRADADMDQDGYVPNEEMRMLTAIREVLAKAEGRL
jgi:hypothetical protein